MPAANFSTQTANFIPPTKAKTTVNTNETSTSNIPLVKKKLDVMYSFVKNMSTDNLNIVKNQINNFLNDGELKFHFALGTQSRMNEVLTRALFNIFVNSNDTNLQIRAKQAIKNSLNPLLNSVFVNHILMSYNHSEYGEFPIKQIDPVVKHILQKTFEYFFAQAWSNFVSTNIGPNNTFISGNFIGYLYDMMTGKGGTRNKSGFGHFYNEYKRHPEKYTQEKAIDPSKVKLDRSNQTISDIIKYIYGVGGKPDENRMNAFNKANKEIFNSLNKIKVNPLLCKAFDYIVGSRLDAEEIVDSDKNFKDKASVTSAFAQLQTNQTAVSTIDSIYKKNKLELPSFKNWKSSDINKGPSDRGELKADASEIGRDEKGNLAKIKYNQYGEKSFATLQELRMFIRNLLSENFININTILNN